MTAQHKPKEAQDEKAQAREELRNLQDKFHGLLDQRNHYNDLSREARDARNLLNDQRREKAEELQTHKAARDAANDRMRAHKETRNALQDQAKALISDKRGKAGGMERSLPLRIRKLRNEIEAAQERQETSVLSIEKERDLIDGLRHKRKELKELEAEMEKQQLIKVDLDDTDKAIDELFGRADAEHELVTAANTEAREHHDKFVAALKEIRVIQGEADEKHKAFIALRQKADDLHGKAMELREKVMAVKQQSRDEFRARRQEIRDVQQAATKAVSDPKALEKATDDALELLKKGGKISL